MYDAIFVGARCAGAPLAMLLAQKGYRVLLTDKSHFPRDTISTHHILQTAGTVPVEEFYAPQNISRIIEGTRCPVAA